MTFKITLQPGRQSFPADPATNLLQAALDAELVVPYGCRDGACGACRARVVSGEVDHGRSPLATLPDAERAAGMALMCCAHARSDLVLECREVRALHDIPVRKLPCRIQALERLAPDVMRMQLRLPAGDAFLFQPGQYIDFLLADGQRRSFSIANAPQADNMLELHVRLIPDGHFTPRVFDQLKPRDILRIEGPLGSFFLREASTPEAVPPLVFLAGGTGIAPLKAIVEDLIAHGAARDIALYWGARDIAGLYLDGLAHAWQSALPGLRYIPVISDEAPDGWHGRTGLVHHAVLADLPDLSAHHVYACGSPAMIEAARADFCTRGGLAADNFHADAFTFSRPDGA
ncbi:MAG: CDP-6-deoxy-delta-3,4-glucoseen reductase [Candidatus Dactylopiibacterium sp.]|nr:CDP-6-deoxy-delta-3,4-glucoseen reductase [Candidatus Dactylopiibacterium sp.]